MSKWKCVYCFEPVGEVNGGTLDCPECGGCPKCCTCPSKLELTEQEVKTIWDHPIFNHTTSDRIVVPRLADADMCGIIFVTDGHLTMPLPADLVVAIGPPPGMTIVPSPEPDVEPPEDLFVDARSLPREEVGAEDDLRFHVYQILGVKTKPKGRIMMNLGRRNAFPDQR